MLILQLRLFCLFLFLFFFSFSFFYFFLNVKDGVTPLFIAAQEGHEQIVQLLFEKGEPNVDLATKVILLIVSFSFFLSLLFLICVGDSLIVCGICVSFFLF